MTKISRIKKASTLITFALTIAVAFSFVSAQVNTETPASAAVDDAAVVAEEGMVVDVDDTATDDNISESEAPPNWPPSNDPSVQIAEMMPKANKAIVTDIANGSDRAIAVGERGHIFVSPSRRDWIQVENVPTRSNLTAVAAIENDAWAVGHDGVILHSADGGTTWERQRANPWNPDSDDLRNGAPLLDVLFLDKNQGFAVGAYSLLLHTEDGGKNWNRIAITVEQSDEFFEEEIAVDESGQLDQSTLALEVETDPHLNSITRTGDGSLYIVAERGSSFRSNDSGRSWSRVQMPYSGSMFGVIGFEAQHLLAFGLRGNVFESFDLGTNWQKVETGTELSLMGGVGQADGGAVIVGANGAVLVRATTTDAFKFSSTPESSILAAVLEDAEGGEIVIGGENGFATFQP